MPVVTPNITRGRRLLLTLFVVAAVLVLGGLLTCGTAFVGSLLPEWPSE